MSERRSSNANAIVALIVMVVAYEALCAACYAVHAGWLGGVGIAAGPVSVMIVEETADRRNLTPGQLGIITSHSPDGFLAWIAKHGEQDKGGAFRLIDKDDAMDQDEEKWRTALAAYKTGGGTVPWLVVSRGGRVLLSEAMPKEAEETMKTLKRFGGN